MEFCSRTDRHTDRHTDRQTNTHMQTNCSEIRTPPLFQVGVKNYSHYSRESYQFNFKMMFVSSFSDHHNVIIYQLLGSSIHHSLLAHSVNQKPVLSVCLSLIKTPTSFHCVHDTLEPIDFFKIMNILIYLNCFIERECQ